MSFIKTGKEKNNISETGILEKKEDEVILKVASKDGKKVDDKEEKSEGG